jgi:hypothetical protein
MFAVTKDKVWNGKYLGYEGYITATVTSALPTPKYSVTVSAPSFDTSSGAVNNIMVDAFVNLQQGYMGNPVLTAVASANYCTPGSGLFQMSDTRYYYWSCKTDDPFAHHSYTVTFYANDGGPQQVYPVSINY